MPDAPWKKWERVVAQVLGGARRGPGTGRGFSNSGKNDVVHPSLSVECKHGKQLGYQDALDACRQAAESAENGQVPVAFLHRKGANWRDGLVVMRLGDFDEVGVPALLEGLTDGAD